MRQQGHFVAQVTSDDETRIKMLKLDDITTQNGNYRLRCLTTKIAAAQPVINVVGKVKNVIQLQTNVLIVQHHYAVIIKYVVKMVQHVQKMIKEK